MKIINLTFFIVIMISSFSSIFSSEITVEEFMNKYFKKSVEIDEIFLPPKLAIDDSRIYICDKKYCQIHVFSIMDGKKINVFGKKGEGPGEFQSISDINFSRDSVYVCSPFKLSIFSKDGKYLKDNRASALEKTFIPFQQNYVTKRYVYDPKKNETHLTYLLLDNNLKKLKEIFQIPYKQMVARDKNKEALIFFNDCRKGIVYKDRFYLGITDLGFYIAVFDLNGNKLYEIKKEYEKIMVTDELKQRINDQIKYVSGKSFDRFKAHREVLFPEFFPAFVNFFVESDKIYIFKYPRIGSKGRLDVLLLDLNGTHLAKRNIPLGSYYKQLEEQDYTALYKGKLYFLDSHEESFWIYELRLDDLFK